MKEASTVLCTRIGVSAFIKLKEKLKGKSMCKYLQELILKDLGLSSNG